MDLDRPITSIMTREVTTIEPEAPLEDAERILFSNSFKHLPVLKEDRLVGILSKTDIKRMSFAQDLDDFEANVDEAMVQMFTVGNIMVSKPFTVQQDATIRDVAKVLSEKEFRSVPVMDGETLAGIVTTSDIIRAILEEV